MGDTNRAIRAADYIANHRSGSLKNRLPPFSGCPILQAAPPAENR
nr:hypothetical protein [uncultured Kingella sp.]